MTRAVDNTKGEKGQITAPTRKTQQKSEQRSFSQRVMEKMAQRHAQQQVIGDRFKPRPASKLSEEETIPRRSRTHKQRSKDLEEVSALSGAESCSQPSITGRRSRNTPSSVAGTSALKSAKGAYNTEDANRKYIRVRKASPSGVRIVVYLE